MDLMPEARQGRLVLYTGAGLSLAEPAAGPRGWEVADRLLPLVADSWMWIRRSWRGMT